MVLLLPIGFRRTGLCIFPGAVLGRDEPGCGPHKTHTVSAHTNTNTHSALSVNKTFIQHNNTQGCKINFSLKADCTFCGKFCNCFLANPLFCLSSNLHNLLKNFLHCCSFYFICNILKCIMAETEICINLLHKAGFKH